MNKEFNTEDKIGDVVTNFPGASDIFYKYGIDLYYGANRPLKNTIAEQDLDEVKLVDHIVNTHHTYLNEVLPKLSEYTFKIMKVHGRNHSELFQVHRLFNNLRIELEEHMVKEEELLFPLIKKYDEENSKETRKEVKKIIIELEKENTNAADILKEIREQTHQYSLPEDSCKTFAATYKNLQEIELDLLQHIHLENNMLFKNV